MYHIDVPLNVKYCLTECVKICMYVNIGSKIQNLVFV